VHLIREELNSGNYIPAPDLGTKSGRLQIPLNR
jgi:hypothetical protein